jgi:outer membrane protein assembly factor BamB
MVMANSSLITSTSRVRLVSAKTGTLGWEAFGFYPNSSAIVVEGSSPTTDHLFVGDVNGVIHQLALLSGVEQAQFPNAGGIVWGLAYDDGIIYANAGNNLTAYNVNPPSLLWTHAMGNYSWGPPFVADGIVYSGSWDGKLYAIRADGTPAWISSAFDFWATQPIVVNGVVYATAWEKLVALDARTGDIIWQSSTPNGATCTDPLSFGAGRLYVGTAWGGLLCAFDPATGDELWSSNFGGHPTPPTYYRGRVFAAAQHGAGNGYLKAFDAADGTLLWTSQVPVGSNGDAVSRAVFDEGFFTNRVFVSSQDGNTYAFQSTNGSLIWKAVVGSGWPADPTWVKGTETRPWEFEPDFGDYYTIDPLALVLRSDIYVKINLPYPPPMERAVALVRKSAGGMRVHEQEQALAQLRNLDRITRMLRQAITRPREQPLRFDQEEPH